MRAWLITVIVLVMALAPGVPVHPQGDAPVFERQRRLGFGGPYRVRWTADDTALVLWSYAGIWVMSVDSLASGLPWGPWLMRSGSFSNVAVSTEGLVAVGNRAEQTIEIWEVDTGGSFRRVNIVPYEGYLEQLSFDPDGTALTVVRTISYPSESIYKTGNRHATYVDRLNAILVWEEETPGATLISMRLPPLASNLGTRLHVSPDGSMTAFDDFYSDYHLYVVPTAELVYRPTLDGSGPRMLTFNLYHHDFDSDARDARQYRPQIGFSPRNTWVYHHLLEYPQDRVYLTNLDTKVPVILEGDEHEIWGMTFSPDDRYVAALASDRAIRLWHTWTGELEQLISFGAGPGFDLSFDSASARLAAADREQRLWIWDVQALRAGAFGPTHEVWLPGVREAVDLALDRMETQLLVNDHNTIIKWDLLTGEAVSKITNSAPGEYFGAIAANPDASRVAVIIHSEINDPSEALRVELWDVDEARQIEAVTPACTHSNPQMSKRDSKLIAYWTYTQIAIACDEGVYLWNPQLGSLQQIIAWSESALDAVAFDWAREIVAVAQTDEITYGSLDGGSDPSLPPIALAADREVQDIYLGPAGTGDPQLAVLYTDGALDVYDLNTGDLRYDLTLYTDEHEQRSGVINSASFIGEDYLATAGADVVTLWDRRSGELVTTLNAQVTPIAHIYAPGQGDTLVIAGKYGVVEVWRRQV